MTSSLRSTGSTRRWRKLRRFVLDRDGWRCQLWVDDDGDHVEDGDRTAVRRCLAAAGHVDHVVERRHATAAGLVVVDERVVHVDDPANLRASCAAGNLGRPRTTSERPTRPGPNVTPGRWSW